MGKKKKTEGTAKYVDWKENDKGMAMRTGVVSWVERQRKLQLLTDKEAHSAMELMMQLLVLKYLQLRQNVSIDSLSHPVSWGFAASGRVCVRQRGAF